MQSAVDGRLRKPGGRGTRLILTNVSHVADDGVALVDEPGENARGVCASSEKTAISKM